MDSLYKSPEGKKEIIDIYEARLAELNIDYKYNIVKTSYGDTNMIITGSPSNPPLLVIHGSNGCAPIALDVYSNLSSKYQVFAIDVLAQPNKSAETRLSMKDDSYGKWINEIIDTLKLEDVTMTGFSFGGLVILKTLENNEAKIKEVFLTAPAYIVNGNPLKALFKIFIPMKRYIKTAQPKYLEKFLNVIFTERDEFAVKFLSKVFLNFTMDFDPVPVIKTKAAKLITTPITLISAKEDVIFPGIKMIKRANKIFPSLKQTVLLENSKHVQNPADNIRVEQIILNQ